MITTYTIPELLTEGPSKYKNPTNLYFKRFVGIMVATNLMQSTGFSVRTVATTHGRAVSLCLAGFL